MKRYIVMLEGQGDLSIYIVDQVHWDWIHNKETLIPNDIINGRMEGHKFCSPISDRQKAIEDIGNYEGPNSWYNDRALALSWGKTIKSFYNIKEYTKYIQENPIEIIDEWRGYIY